jgi:hypothetical protein
MTNIEAIQTIREALEWVDARYDSTSIISKALAALDSLAVEPSEKKCLTCAKQCPNDCPMDKLGEDALELVKNIISTYESSPMRGTGYDYFPLFHAGIDEAAALITDHDELIRRECADRAWAYTDVHSRWDYSSDGSVVEIDDDDLRAAIMGRKE